VNWIDLSLGLIVCVSMVVGLQAGFARTATGLVAAALGLVFGLRYYHVVGHRLHLAETGVANLIGFLIIFCAIAVLGGITSGVLVRAFRELDLVWLDRLLGAGFGALRGLLFATILIWGLMAFFPVRPKVMLAQSRLAPCVMDAARRIADASPDEVKRTFRQSYRELNKLLPENIKSRLTAVPSGEI
jgi:membrane protein required for colicin V production